jgi:hypothetical protein
MEGKAGESYPSLARLMEYTGLRKHTVTDARQWLRDNGWLTSTGQRRTDGRFSIPIECTTIPPVPDDTDGRKPPTDGRKATNDTDGRKPTNGAGRKATSDRGRKTASSKSPTEVDPVLEVDPKEKKREREVVAPSATAPNPTPALPLPPSAKTCTGKRGINDAIEIIKGLNPKAQVSKKAKNELQAALSELGGTSEAELVWAVKAKLKLCNDDVSYAIFGSSLASDLVASIRAMRSRTKEESEQAPVKQWLADYWQHCCADEDCGEAWLAANEPARGIMTVEVMNALDNWGNQWREQKAARASLTRRRDFEEEQHNG